MRHFWILFTKEIYIEASHLSPPNHFKWFWWEIAKQVKFFKDTAPDDYQRLVQEGEDKPILLRVYRARGGGRVFMAIPR